MIRVVSSSANTERARSLVNDLREMNFQAEMGSLAKGDIVIAALSSADSKLIPADVITALDLGLHMIAVKLEPLDLPKLIDHLPVIQGSSPDYPAELKAQIEAVSAEYPLTLKVRTPKVQRSNLSFGIFVSALALMMFIVGIIGVGVLGLQAPQREYDEIDTQVALTRDYLVGPELLYFSTWLPRSTEDAQNYSATLQQLPTAYRPLMGLTVTAYAQGTPLPPITTPVPGE